MDAGIVHYLFTGTSAPYYTDHKTRLRFSDLANNWNKITHPTGRSGFSAMILGCCNVMRSGSDRWDALPVNGGTTYGRSHVASDNTHQGNTGAFYDGSVRWVPHHERSGNAYIGAGGGRTWANTFPTDNGQSYRHDQLQGWARTKSRPRP
jgi:hypothetical protein